MGNRRMPCSVGSCVNSFSSVLQYCTVSVLVWGSVVSTRTVSCGWVEVENDNTHLRNLYQDSSVVNRMPCNVVSCVNSYSSVLQGGTVSGGGIGAENDMVLLTDMIKTSICRIYRYVIMSTENMESKWLNPSDSSAVSPWIYGMDISNSINQKASWYSYTFMFNNVAYIS